MNRPYEEFSGPARTLRDLNVLEGLLLGVSADGVINPTEMKGLRIWCTDHQGTGMNNLFRDLLVRLEEALEDGRIDAEELEDLLWLCERARTPNPYYSVATSDIQRLHGLLAGVALDGRVSEQELQAVRHWIDGVQHLRTTWPYDEIDSIVRALLEDRTIDANEHGNLVRFCQGFLNSVPGAVTAAVPGEEAELIRGGVCAFCPEISFQGRSFCATGKPSAGSKSDIEAAVVRLGGEPLPRVVNSLNYLVIGGDGDRCWAFSCYGRKVEQAMTLRRRGAPVVIVHETDFWDAAEDLGEARPRA